MEPTSIVAMAKWSGGEVVGSRDVVLVDLSTDSRTLAPGACFVALAGERFDGHDFLGEAFARGAGAGVVARSREDAWSDYTHRLPLVVVDDTTRALQEIAAGYRRRFSIPVIGVTGSNGKTTTKDMIAAILRVRAPVAATEKNLNNHIGLPLSLLQLESGHRAAVVEMGMNARGEIARLAEIAQPTVGVVTNVGPVHLEFLQDLEGVAAAKAELVEALPADGWAVLNADDSRVAAMAKKTRAQTITFGFSPEADVRAVDVEMLGFDGSRFTLVAPASPGDPRREEVEIVLGVPGRHHVMNALAAAAASMIAGADGEAIRLGLRGLSLSEMRMQVIRLTEGVTVINDAYNASPLSTRAALETLAQAGGRRKVAVLGDMLELGEAAQPAHEEIGRLAAELGVDLLVGIGPLARTILQAASEGLPQGRTRWYENALLAAAEATDWIEPGDAVLVKGSRGIRLERVVEALEARLGPAGPPVAGRMRQ